MRSVVRFAEMIAALKNVVCSRSAFSLAVVILVGLRCIEEALVGPVFAPGVFYFVNWVFPFPAWIDPSVWRSKNGTVSKPKSAGTPAVFYLQRVIANRASQKIILCELFVEPRLVTLCSENTLDRFVPLYSYGCWHVWLFAAMAAMLASLKGRCAFSLLALQIYTYLH